MRVCVFVGVCECVCVFVGVCECVCVCVCVFVKRSYRRLGMILKHLTQWIFPQPCTVPEEDKRFIRLAHKILIFFFRSGQEAILSPHIPVKVLHHRNLITFPHSFGWQAKGQVYQQLTLEVTRGGVLLTRK